MYSLASIKNDIVVCIASAVLKICKIENLGVLEFSQTLYKVSAAYVFGLIAFLSFGFHAVFIFCIHANKINKNGSERPTQISIFRTENQIVNHILKLTVG